MKYEQYITRILLDARDVGQGGGSMDWMVEEGYTMENTWPFAVRLEVSIQSCVRKYPRFFKTISRDSFSDVLYAELTEQESSEYPKDETLCHIAYALDEIELGD